MNRKEEILLKENRIRKLMDSLGLKGIILKKQSNYSWFTAGGRNMVSISTDIGFSTILITLTDKYCIANRIEAERNMREEGLKSLGFSLVQYEWYENKELELIESIIPLNELGCDIPLEGTCFIGDKINELRYSLTPSEIERYLWLGEKTSEAIESVLMEIEPGNSEAEVIGELTKRLWRNNIDQVGFQAASDERAYMYRHAIPTERKIEKYLMLNVMSRKWGLITTITRIVHFGKIPEELMKQYKDNVFIECAMINATKPGKVTGDIFKEARDLYEKLGYSGEWELHHQGGAMGYEVRDFICNENSTDIVQKNQCFCWNPSISGTKSEDAIIAKDDGFIFITKPVIFPKLSLEIEDSNFIRPNILER